MKDPTAIIVNFTTLLAAYRKVEPELQDCDLDPVDVLSQLRQTILDLILNQKKGNQQS